MEKIVTKVVTEVVTYKPTKNDLLDLTNTHTLTSAAKELGLTRKTLLEWRKDGISEKIYNKYWRDNEQ